MADTRTPLIGPISRLLIGLAAAQLIWGIGYFLLVHAGDYGRNIAGLVWAFLAVIELGLIIGITLIRSLTARRQESSWDHVIDATDDPS